MENMETLERINELQPRVMSLNSYQKAIFDEINHLLNSRRVEHATRSNGKLFFLQQTPVTRNTFTLQMLQKYAESEGHIVLITAVTNIVSLLHQGGRTFHSLLGPKIDYKGSAEHGTSPSSNFGPRSHQTELLRKSDLIIMDVVSMLDRTLFEMVDILLNDLRCSSRVYLRARFGVLCMVVAADYLKLLAVVPSRG